MVRIDRRVPIKVIAQDLGVSETRINQHIRALKDIYEAGSLGDLVERYRATLPQKNKRGHASEKDSLKIAERSQNIPSAFPLLKDEGESTATSFDTLSKTTYSKNQVPNTNDLIESPDEDELGDISVKDVLPIVEKAPWLRRDEPKVVPGVLDGEHAALFRFGAIMLIAFGFLAAVVLTVTTAVSISEALDGEASVPVDEQGQT
ncbi:MAG: hypothetical protein AAGK17_12695 [Pseudomonadota bacterium]